MQLPDEPGHDKHQEPAALQKQPEQPIGSSTRFQPKLGLLNIALIPLLMLSLGTYLLELTRVYVTSGIFAASIVLGGLSTMLCATFWIANRALRAGIVTLFGLVVPVMYVYCAGELYKQGFHDTLSPLNPWFDLLGLIGFTEILIYLLCVLGTLLYGITHLLSGRKKGEPENQKETEAAR